MKTTMVKWANEVHRTKQAREHRVNVYSDHRKGFEEGHEGFGDVTRDICPVIEGTTKSNYIRKMVAISSPICSGI